MAERASENRFLYYARGVEHSLGEFVHVSAIYLGIAVLVTLVLSVTVPSLREQSRQMHSALLTALRPDSLSDDVINSVGQREDNFFSVVAESALTPSDNSPAAPSVPAASVASAAPVATGPPATNGKPSPNKGGVKPDLSTPADFSNALSTAAGRLSIPGVSGVQAQALRSYIARKYKIAHNVAGVLIKAAFVVGKEQHLDPQLLLAVIAVESRYNPFAESHIGAQGLMQVMTEVHKDKFKGFAEGTIAALNPVANMRVGSQILYDCIKRRGSVKAGLACYVGAAGPEDNGYGAKVLAERRRIALASGIPIGPDAPLIKADSASSG
jgi:soluble lytic murein transglycosylase-like protein